jgi:hypothetical protein
MKSRVKKLKEEVRDLKKVLAIVSNDKIDTIKCLSKLRRDI